MTADRAILGRRPRLAILGFCLVALACLSGAGSAAAQQFVPHVFKSTFEGEGSTGGSFGEVSDVAADQQTGDVYVASYRSGTGLLIYKFDSQGVPAAFSALGGSTVLLVTSGEAGGAKIAVDNSSGPNQGRIYVTSSGVRKTWAFNSSGTPVGGKFPIEAGGTAIGFDPSTEGFWLDSPSLVGRVVEYRPDGTETTTTVTVAGGESFGVDLDPQGHLYTYAFKGGLTEYERSGSVINTTAFTYGAFATNQVNGNAIFDEFAGAKELDPKGNRLPGFAFEGSFNGSVAINGVNNYVYLSSGNNSVSVFAPGPAVTLPDVELLPGTNFEPTSVQVNATVDPDGVKTTECQFEYGPNLNYGSTAPCTQGQELTGTSPISIDATLPGLTKGVTYHYRLSLTNANAAPNNTLKSKDATVTASGEPVVQEPYVDEVHSDSVTFHADVTPEGAPTTFHVLYGTADCLTEPGLCTASPETASIGSGLNPVLVGTKVTGLRSGTTYHYVIVATNQTGTTDSAEETFTTFPFNPVLEDRCGNAHVRQQTGAALLSDCRAYELVSAENLGGYNVESYLVAGETPYGGYPEAENPPRVLYGVHDGAIPGSGNPTNHGLDPYIATRGEDGWTTSYVGIPANTPYSAESFASPLAAADARLDAFAFGGPDLCSPCFGDGTTGIPVRTSDGSLVQGMTGSENPGPAAKPNILVKKYLSADGRHLIFGSTSEFEAGAGSPAIYDRDLETGATHAVSKLPGGGAIPCLMQCESAGLAELDVSADGSRILLGQLVRVDGSGNRYWHLYMNVGDAGRTIDLTPGATDGVLYGGMTTDGSVVYFTTIDALTGEDADHSADLYRAEVGASAAQLTDVSLGSGGSGNSDSCTPVGNSVYTHWNTTGSEANCGVVAVGGGGGVAARNDTTYFLSPQLLDGSAEPQDGVQNAPNLYLSRAGSPPHFVATLESSLTGSHPPLLYHPFESTIAPTRNPKFVAVDDSGGPSDGDFYVVDTTEQVIRKYTAEGNLITSYGAGGELEFSFSASISGIAVGPTGKLYVAIEQIENSANDLFEFSDAGAPVGADNVEGAPGPLGITIDSQERVYYESAYTQTILRWQKSKGSVNITTGEYQSGPKTALAVDPNSGELFVSLGGSRIARYEFDSSERVVEAGGVPCVESCEPTQVFGAEEVSGVKGLVVDPSNGDVYVDEGNKIPRYRPNGRKVPGPATGGETLSNSTAVAISSDGHVYATNSGTGGAGVQKFGPLVLAPDPRGDNPLVVDSVREPEARHTGDFQITPDGTYAAFVSTIPFTGYDNAGQEEVFRYDAPSGHTDCASCAPTNAIATGGASLAADGLSLSDDGRVFFNSTDPLSPRDLDNREDVYQWENGEINLVSTGISQFGSSLLTASSEGTDVFFFTRDSLVPQDLNGRLVKIYDARAGGGFPYTPPPASCKASDECHGASTPAPPPPSINTVTGTRGNQPAPLTCKKGQVKKHGKCVKKKKKKKKKHHKHHKAAAKRARSHQRGGHR